MGYHAAPFVVPPCGNSCTQGKGQGRLEPSQATLGRNIDFAVVQQPYWFSSLTNLDTCGCLPGAQRVAAGRARQPTVLFARAIIWWVLA